MIDVRSLEFWQIKPLIGMVHLPALPGSPMHDGSAMESVLTRAVADARALEDGGADAVMVENFFDAPFPKDHSPPHTIAAMALAVQAVREAVSIPVGVNVLRNDVRSALAIAHTCAAQFVRVNVYVGAAVTDQGIIEGAARQAVLYRRELGAAVAIWADVFVKHAAPLGSSNIEDLAHDAISRGRADALIISGSATGQAADPEDARRIKAVLPTVPVLIGSGLNSGNAAALLSHADGAIVGTGLKAGGDVSAPVDKQRVEQIKAAIGSSLVNSSFARGLRFTCVPPVHP